MSRINYIDINYDSKLLLEEIKTPESDIYTFKLQKDKISKISKMLGISFVKDILYFNFPEELFAIIHKDIDIETQEYTNTYSLIIPLENCNDLYINWFDSVTEIDETITREFSRELITGPSLEQKDSILLESKKLDRPALIKDIIKWHNAENKSKNIARFLNIRFHKFIDYEKSLDLIKKNSITR
jgi:hypothetical protein